MNYRQTFIHEIMRLSNAGNWDFARKEWDVEQIALIKGSTCLCGKHPIREVIRMRNRENGHEVDVGNCCVKKFFGNSEWSKSFKALAKGRINEQLIAHAHHKKKINDWERNFLYDVWRRRSMTAKQRAKFNALTKRIVEAFRTDKPILSKTSRFK